LFRKKKQKKPDRYGSWHKIRKEKHKASAEENISEQNSSFSVSEAEKESETHGAEHILNNTRQDYPDADTSGASSHARTFEEDESLEQLDAIISNLKQKSHLAESERVSSSVQTGPNRKEIDDLVIALISRLEQCSEKDFASAVSSETVQKLKVILTERKFPLSESAEG